MSMRHFEFSVTLLAEFHIWRPGPGCIKSALKYSVKSVTYESVIVTLTGVAWNARNTLVSSSFTWKLTGSLKGTDVTLIYYFMNDF